MTERQVLLSLLVALPSAIVSSSHQQTPPTRDLGAIVATSSESIRVPVVVRGLANGNVLVNLAARGRILLLDSSLVRVASPLDSAKFPNASSLIPFSADSTIAVDIESQTLLVIDNQGRAARVMSLPKQADIRYVANGALYGMPVVDAKGRLIYRGAYKSIPGTSRYGPVLASALSTVADSAPIVRADFASRTVDTIGSVRINVLTRNTSAEPDATGNAIVMKVAYNPFATNDGWVGLRDGTIGFVRAHDYHVDWISPDDRRQSTPKMPIVQQRLTDEDKQRKLDSMRPMLAMAQRSAPATMGSVIMTDNGTRPLKFEYAFPALEQIRDYETPFFPELTRVDGEGNLWILPRAAAGSADRLLYDVVNRSGQITERVRLPAGRVLAGFGPTGVAYLTNYAAYHLESARIR